MRLLSSSDILFVVWDVETTITDGDPSYFVPKNEMVLAGANCVFTDGTSVIKTFKPGATWDVLPGVQVLVGHNFGFDLHYLRADAGEEDFAAWMDASHIWDTQIAEYVLSGQHTMFASMDDLAKKYELPTKDEAHENVVKLFKEGLGADYADPDELKDYLVHDLQVTEAIAKLQMEAATDEQFNLIIEMGEALKGVQECEWNGMHIDEEFTQDRLSALAVEMGASMLELKELVEAHGKDTLEYAKSKEFNLSTNNQFISSLLFGGTLEYVTKEPIGLYKSGKRKGMTRYKNVTNSIKFKRLLDPNDYTTATKTRTKHGDIVYTVDEDVLSKVVNDSKLNKTINNIITNIVDYKKQGKIFNTYYSSFLEKNVDGIIHHTLNQTATRTGRLSSTKPNLQNVPMSGDNPLLNVKDVFSSRYGEDGVMVEIDFKQLEVCVLAWLTQDAQLLDDLIKGVDIHGTIADAIGWDGTDKRIRRDVKGVVFAMIYGAGAKGIASSTGIDIEKVKKIMGAFKARYYQVDEYYEQLRETVIKEGSRMDLITRGPHGPEHMFEWVSPTGRTYLFGQDPYRPGPKHTQLRNYPVQGTATGDIVPMLLGRIVRVLRNELHKSHQVKLVTSTHDSVTLDCRNEDDAKHVVRLLDHRVFSQVNDIINEAFPDMEWNVPLVVEVERGPSWGEMKEVDIR